MRHPLNAAFLLFLLLSLSACVISPRRDINGGGGSGGTGIGQLYVTNQSANTILRFAGATAVSGNVAPTATISSSALSSPRYIFIDSTNNRLYVANAGASNILVFDNASTLSGSVTPTRVITSINLGTPADVALDPVTNLLYVADNLEIAVFGNASTANGNTPALRVILPGFTPDALHLDATNNRLFAADHISNTIDVFDGASLLTGSVAATRTITGPDTQLSAPLGLQIDGAGRLVVSNSSPASITIYPNAATIFNDTPPAAVISGSNTQLSGPAQLALDPTTNSGELYIADPAGANVVVFSSITTVTGSLNPAPNRNLVGPSTTLTGAASATGVALDTAH
jgi:DNA-binding beta-propeller fold protein YncE